MNCNVISDPWIKVRTIVGTEETVGVRECLLRAQEIETLLPPGRIAMQEFAIYLFLIAFIADCYKPADDIDILDMHEAGKFDAGLLDEYIRSCGDVFEIFNEKSPFMQCPVDQLPKKVGTVNVSKLSPAFKSGNNDMFFGINPALVNQESHYEDTQKMDISDYISTIMMSHIAAVASGQGYSSAITTAGQPPVYFLNKGKTLFDTICASIDATEEADVPMWRRKTYLWDITKEPDIGWLSLAFYPVRYIAPAESAYDGHVIRTVRYGGVRFNAMEGQVLHPKDALPIWVKSCPFIAKRETLDGIRPVIFRADDPYWTHIPDFYGVTGANIFKKSPKICKKDVQDMLGYAPTLSIYTVTLGTKSEKRPVQGKFENIMPFELWGFENSDRETVLSFISYAKRLAGILYMDLTNSGLASAESAEKCSAEFKEFCKQTLFEDMIPALQKKGKGMDYMKRYGEDLIQKGTDLFLFYASSVSPVKKYKFSNFYKGKCTKELENYLVPQASEKAVQIPCRDISTQNA